MEDFNCKTAYSAYIGINGHIVQFTTIPFYEKEVDRVISRHFKIIDNVWEEITEEQLLEFKEEMREKAVMAKLNRDFFPYLDKK
jgi:hypothetical protein